MSDPILATLVVLNADATVTGLVGTAISPVIAAQNTAPPFVTLIALSVSPVNHLRGFGQLDECRVIITAWATTYVSAQAIASACRSAMETAGHICESRSEDAYELDPSPGLFHVEYQFLMWL